MSGRRVWLKDYGWTPVGSFKLLGALNWMGSNLEQIGDRPVAAHSSGNFAQAFAYAGRVMGVPITVVMLDRTSPYKVAATEGHGAVSISAARMRSSASRRCSGLPPSAA